MSSFLVNVVLWTLAIYGLIEIIRTLVHIYYHPKISSSGIYLFIAVKNGENKIEGFLRSILFKILYGKDESIDNIFVVDLNSTDRTADILDILSNDYPYIKFTDMKHCKEILDSISDCR